MLLAGRERAELAPGERDPQIATAAMTRLLLRTFVTIACLLVVSSPAAAATGVAASGASHASSGACRGVRVGPADDVMSVLGRHAARGTTFCFGAGVYHTGQIYPPASGDVLDGTSGAVLDGGWTYGRAIANYHDVSDVTIRGFEIRHYANATGAEDGAISAWHGGGWTIQHNRIHDNGASGITLGLGGHMVARWNVLKRNGCAGINSTGVDNVIAGNDITGNGFGPFRVLGWSCGGGKSNRSFGLRFVGNNVHGNRGHGFWFDGGNTSVTVERNRFVHNTVGGLMIEINDPDHGGPHLRMRGFGFKVLHNVFSGNGFAHPNRVMYGDAIDIAASSHVVVAGNRITAYNAHAITLTCTARAGFPGQDLRVHDVSVHDNRIALRESRPLSNPFDDLGRVGFYSATPGQPAPSGISFFDNRYFFDHPRTYHFSLPRRGASTPYRLATWRQWKRAGFDRGSTAARR